MDLYGKFNALKKNIKPMKSLAVAFSGGVDSTFLLKAAHDELKDNVMAIIAHSSTYPEREFNEAMEFVMNHHIKYRVIFSQELNIVEFTSNPPDRCYHCKKQLFSEIIHIAKENQIDTVADGTNFDDINDFRPGMKATRELNVISPLMDAGLSKKDIRILSKEMALSTWNKPSFACFATRFPYGQEITPVKLKMVEKSEQFLIDLGFRQVRVRHHGDIARIEVSPEERHLFFNEELMDKVYDQFKTIGFLYVSLDLKGYRTGSMNEAVME